VNQGTLRRSEAWHMRSRDGGGGTLTSDVSASPVGMDCCRSPAVCTWRVGRSEHLRADARSRCCRASGLVDGRGGGAIPIVPGPSCATCGMSAWNMRRICGGGGQHLWLVYCDSFSTQMCPRSGPGSRRCDLMGTSVTKREHEGGTATDGVLTFVTTSRLGVNSMQQQAADFS